MVMVALDTVPPIAIGMQDNFGAPVQVLTDVLPPVGVWKAPPPQELIPMLLLVGPHAQWSATDQGQCRVQEE